MPPKIKLKIVVNGATHFYKWERPYFNREFEIVDSSAEDVVVFAFGPDVLESSAEIPALKRFALLFPGFGFNPYHNLATREHALELVDRSYDGIFVNPGPVEEAFKKNQKVYSHPFSIDVERILKHKKKRQTLNSLIHVSSPGVPQKDWERSQEIMERTGLKFEVFPSRSTNGGLAKVSWTDRIRWRYNKYVGWRFDPKKRYLMQHGYQSHRNTIKKYLEYDGFVHIAEEKLLPEHLDGKYTASLLEAGMTGSIVFWHDTFTLGNDFETIFAVSKDPVTAAAEILEKRSGLNVEQHSRLTSEEIADRCHPGKVVKFRKDVIESLI